MNSGGSSPISFLLKSLTVLALPIIVVSLLVFGVPKYYYSVTDWAKLQNYTPDPEIEALADSSYMTDEGRRIFYVNDPELNEKAEFNVNCPFAERSFVLGCFTGNRIYLLNVTDEQLKSVETVTAAHEMLHAAYERLDTKERERIDALLEKDFNERADDRLVSLIDDYRKQDEASVPTELHSILPTELKELSPELEEYFDRYFTDREKVVEAYLGYEQVFSRLEKKIESLESQISSLKSRISSLDADIKQTKSDIDSINKELDQKRSSGDISGYNALVPEQNKLVNDYNADVRSYNQAIKDHNDKVKEVNAIVVQQNSLVNSIDSKHEEL